LVWLLWWLNFIGGVMLNFIAVGLGGFVGACLRFGITDLMNKVLPFFHFGTLLSNVLAGFFIGFIVGIERQSFLISPSAKLFLTVGLLGGLSTFSTFSIETIMLIENENYFKAGGNVLLNVCLSLIFVFVGMYVAKFVVKNS
jgi:CrcB protein